MKNIFKKNKRVYSNSIKGRGFAILFAVTLSAILLAIALGVSDVAVREIKFSTLNKSANEAFFAADTGIECALFNDKSTSESFTPTGEGFVFCINGREIIPYTPYPVISFVVSGINNTGQGCAKVTVDKSTATTVVTSKGYNTGGAVLDQCNPTSNSVERQIEVRY